MHAVMYSLGSKYVSIIQDTWIAFSFDLASYCTHLYDFQLCFSTQVKVDIHHSTITTQLQIEILDNSNYYTL